MASSSNEQDLMLFDSMMLLSVLSTAADVHEGINRRRAGRDPRTQEDPSRVRAYLWKAVQRLEDGCIRLFMQQVYTADQEVVRRMDQLLLVRRLTRELHLVHQRLLSLYPAVAEEPVEEVRLLEQRFEALAEGSPDAFGDDLAAAVDHGLQTAGRLRRVLQSTNTDDEM